MAPRPFRERAFSGARLAFAPRMLPALALALVLPAGVSASSRLLSHAFGLHPLVALLAVAAVAFVTAAAVLAAAEHRRSAGRSGTPPASVERERLAGLFAGELARPLEDLVASGVNAGARELLRLMRVTGHRWIPLHDGRLSGFGVAVPLTHLILSRDPVVAGGLAVPVPRVAADAPALEALAALPPGSPPAAVVAQGRAVGFLTRHDLAEAALGTRLPSGRMLERPAWLAREGTAVVRGDVAFSEVERRFSAAEGRGEGTMAAALFARMGRALGPGESLEWDGLRFTVEEFVAHEPVRFRVERLVPR